MTRKHKWKYRINVRNKILVLVILGVSLFVGLGYALIETGLSMMGTLEVNGKLFTYWDNIVVEQNSVVADTPTITNTSVAFNMTLTQPGDYYEFTLDANNAGRDKMISSISNKLNDVEMTSSSLPSYISYSAMYSDGEELEIGHLLGTGTSANPTKHTYKIKVEFLDTIAQQELEDIPSGGLEYSFIFSIGYSIADASAFAKPTPVNFATASWNDIVASYNNGHPSSTLKNAMKAGTTKEVELDLDHNSSTPADVVNVRISNLSRCANGEISETACGFVLEFVETFTSRRFNPGASGSTYGTGNNGSWAYSETRAYVNSTIYREGEEEEQDFTDGGIFTALPANLRVVIIDTEVISGGGTNDKSTNPTFTSTDKLYLLDAREIWGATFTNQYNLAKDYERQLDYYNYNGVTTVASTLGPVIKQDLNGADSSWWLRSAGSGNNSSVWRVTDTGANATQTGTNTNGISPAFRIAE